MDETRKGELHRKLEKERDEIRATMEMPGQEKLADDLDNADQGTLALQPGPAQTARPDSHPCVMDYTRRK